MVRLLLAKTAQANRPVLINGCDAEAVTVLERPFDHRHQRAIVDPFDHPVLVFMTVALEHGKDFTGAFQNISHRNEIEQKGEERKRRISSHLALGD